MTVSSVAVRADGRVGAIAAGLRDRIVAGDWPPGQRLPTRVELEAAFGASSRTIQEALRVLLADGFVRASRQDGTFVVAHPPHLCTFGLVLPGSERISHSSGHWHAILAVAQEQLASPAARGEYYYDLEYAANGGDLPRLTADLQHQRVAGLFFVFPPSKLVGTPALEIPGVPRVALMREGYLPGLGSIVYDLPSYLDLAMRHFAAAGCRRLGLVLPLSFLEQQPLHERHRLFGAAAAAAGMSTRPWWLVGAHPEAVTFLRHHFELLLRQPPDERPDGLLIWDDHLVPAATAALRDLAAAGYPRLCLVGSANFPCPPRTELPVYHIGYDMHQVLAGAMDYIRRGRRGEPLLGAATIFACAQNP